LVHEAYLRLVDPGGSARWEGRGHFFAAAAEAMRRILIDRARDRKRLKRGGGRSRRDLDLDAVVRDDADPDEPEVVITLRAQLAPHKIGQLARFSGRSMTVAMSSAQLGFDIQQGSDGRPSLGPERRGTNG